MTNNLAIKTNQLRIFRGYHRRILNLIKLDRMNEAEYASRALTGILRMWAEQDIAPLPVKPKVEAIKQ